MSLLTDSSLPNASQNDISSVVLVGGTSRVPMVQSALRTYVPDSLIAQNVNADEAAVMGAAFYGASFNQQFRMKDIRAYDINPYAVVLKEDSNNSEVIFPARSFHEDSLLRHFDTVEDIMFELEYDSDKLDTFSKHISHVEIQGITAALANLSSDLSNVDTQINVTFVSNPLGTFGVSSATLTVKPKPGGLAGALKSFFGVTSTKEDEETSLEGEEGDVKNETKPAKKEAKPKDRIIKLTALNAPRGNTSPLSGEELKKSKAKLREIDAAATRKAAREEARNSLEAYLYRIRDLVEDTNFVSASKNEERDLILKRADGLSSWIAEEGERAETSELKLRRAGLETLVKPIEKRLSQRTLRSGAIDKFRESLTKTERFLSEARANLSAALAEGSASKFSVSELDNLEGTFNRNSEWFQAKVKEQESKRLDEDPVLLTDDLEKRARKAEEVVNRLNKRRIPKTRPAKSAGKDKGKKAEQEKEEAPHKDEKKGPTHEEL